MPYLLEYVRDGQRKNAHCANGEEMRTLMRNEGIKPDDPTLTAWHTNVYPVAAEVPNAIPLRKRPRGITRKQPTPPPSPVTCGELWDKYPDDLTEQEDARRVLALEGASL